MVDYLVAQGADLDARTVDGWSPLAIARGLSYSDFYKAQVLTAAHLEALMAERGISSEGGGHTVTGIRLPRLSANAARPDSVRGRS